MHEPHPLSRHTNTIFMFAFWADTTKRDLCSAVSKNNESEKTTLPPTTSNVHKTKQDHRPHLFA